MHPRSCAEYGLFGLGCTEIDAAALRWLKRKSRPETGVEHDDVVVYGCGLEALTAISGLVNSGVDASRITWIVPRKVATELGNDVVRADINELYIYVYVCLSRVYRVSVSA